MEIVTDMEREEEKDKVIKTEKRIARQVKNFAPYVLPVIWLGAFPCSFAQLFSRKKKFHNPKTTL